MILDSQVRIHCKSYISAYNNLECTKFHPKFLNDIGLHAQNFIKSLFQNSLHYLSIFIIHSEIHTYCLNQFAIILFQILIWIIFLYVLRYLFYLYIHSSCTCPFFIYFEFGTVLKYKVS